jgi:hypothetical protein
MLKTSKWRAATVSILAVAVLNLGFTSAAQAGIVNTGALVQTGRDATLASIRGQLDRAEARAQMEKMGVDAADVDARLAALSDTELQELAKKMQDAPAGGDALVLIGAVFVVLIILEFAGIIDIFKRAP